MFVKCQILVFWISSIVLLVSKNGWADNNFANQNDPSLASVFDEVINTVNGGQANQGAANLLSNLGSLVNNVDPSMMNGLLGVMTSMGKETSTGDNTNANILTSIVDLMRLTGFNFENIVKYLPVLASTLNSFTGPEAAQREQQHKNHEQLLPPFIEYLHVLWDHFTSSSLYRTLVNNYDLKNYLSLVTDQNGDIDYEKFLVLLENQKYRKYWMESVADKVASFLRYITDQNSQSQVLESLAYVINNVLTTWNYPPHLRVNMDNKVDSISNLINYFMIKNFDTKLDAKSYVKPSLNYLEELIASARNKGYFFTSSYLTQNIIDILNNEIIEPIVKVYRARKFVQERPSCTFYVLCTINQPDKRDRSHLPGVKLMLTKASSIAASWFISRSSEFSFLTLYNVIITDKNCKVKYLEECAEYHYREEQHTKNYAHNEL